MRNILISLLICNSMALACNKSNIAIKTNYANENLTISIKGADSIELVRIDNGRCFSDSESTISISKDKLIECLDLYSGATIGTMQSADLALYNTTDSNTITEYKSVPIEINYTIKKASHSLLTSFWITQTK